MKLTIRRKLFVIQKPSLQMLEIFIFMSQERLFFYTPKITHKYVNIYNYFYKQEKNLFYYSA